MSSIAKISCTKLEPLADPKHGSPCTRSSHGLSLINGSRLILYGGEHVARTPLDNDQALWAADLLENQQWQWRKIQTHNSNPPARVAHAQAVVNDTVYIFGGRAGITMEEQAMNDLWKLNASTPGKEEWTLVKTKGDPPCARSFHKMVCAGNKSLFVFGGCGAKGRLADLYRFDIGTSTWHDLGTALLRGRGGPNLIPLASGTKLAVVAGFSGEETNDGQIFNIAAESWDEKLLSEELKGMRPRSVCVNGSFPSVGLAVIFGGEVDPSERGHEGAGGFEHDVVVLDEETGRYLETMAAPSKKTDEWPETRGWSDAASLNAGDGTGALYIFGGLAGDDVEPERLGDLWRLDIIRS